MFSSCLEVAAAIAQWHAWPLWRALVTFNHQVQKDDVPFATKSYRVARVEGLHTHAISE